MSNSHYQLLDTRKALQAKDTPASKIATLDDLRVNKSRLVDRTSQASIFLQLPSELRLMIYEALLLEDFNSISIVQTCWQIDMEAQEVLYQRPSSFDSQQKLFAWVARSRFQNLNRIRNVTLRLTDVDLTPMLEQHGLKRHSRVSVWSIYRSDIEKWQQALSSLPNLSSLTIIPPRVGRSSLLRHMYHSFLAEIPRRCSRLRRLEIHDGEDLLQAVPSLRAVRYVVFTDQKSKPIVKLEQELRSSNCVDVIDGLEAKSDPESVSSWRNAQSFS